MAFKITPPITIKVKSVIFLSNLHNMNVKVIINKEAKTMM